VPDGGARRPPDRDPHARPEAARAGSQAALVRPFLDRAASHRGRYAPAWLIDDLAGTLQLTYFEEDGLGAADRAEGARWRQRRDGMGNGRDDRLDRSGGTSRTVLIFAGSALRRLDRLRLPQ